MRTTVTMLENLVRRVNELTNSPIERFTKNKDSYKYNVGNFHLYHATGIWNLCRYSIGGGEETILYARTMKSLEEQIQAFIKGINTMVVL